MRSTYLLRSGITLALSLLLGATMLGSTAGAVPGSSGEDTASVRSPVTERRVAKKPACAPKNCWAAISFNKRTGYSGWSYNARSKKKAIANALRSCRKRRVNANRRRACVSPAGRKVHTRTGCVAVAFRRNNNGRIVKWAKGTAYDEIAAGKKARKAVRAKNGSGTVVLSRWACTFRPAK